jgi:hypothetical protein
MNHNEITFTIQTLDGDTFPISITRTDAENVFSGSGRQYNKYGLDVLNDAICKHTGHDPVIQQLFNHDSELTISDSLIPLENKVITLMIKPSFYINFAVLTDDWFVLFHMYQLDASLDYLRDYSPPSTICYLQKVANKPNPFPIEVLGQFRDFFKIAIKNIPIHLLICDRRLSNVKQYYVTNKTPEYVWLRYDKTHLKII